MLKTKELLYEQNLISSIPLNKNLKIKEEMTRKIDKLKNKYKK